MADLINFVSKREIDAKKEQRRKAREDILKKASPDKILWFLLDFQVPNPSHEEFSHGKGRFQVRWNPRKMFKICNFKISFTALRELQLLKWKS